MLLILNIFYLSFPPFRLWFHSYGYWQSKGPGKQELQDTSPTQVCILFKSLFCSRINIRSSWPLNLRFQNQTFLTKRELHLAHNRVTVTTEWYLFFACGPLIRSNLNHSSQFVSMSCEQFSQRGIVPPENFICRSLKRVSKERKVW